MSSARSLAQARKEAIKARRALREANEASAINQIGGPVQPEASGIHDGNMTNALSPSNDDYLPPMPATLVYSPEDRRHITVPNPEYNDTNNMYNQNTFATPGQPDCKHEKLRRKELTMLNCNVYKQKSVGRGVCHCGRQYVSSELLECENCGWTVDQRVDGNPDTCGIGRCKYQRPGYKWYRENVKGRKVDWANLSGDD